MEHKINAQNHTRLCLNQYQVQDDSNLTSKTLMIMPLMNLHLKGQCVSLVYPGEAVKAHYIINTDKLSNDISDNNIR